MNAAMTVTNAFALGNDRQILPCRLQLPARLGQHRPVVGLIVAGQLALDDVLIERIADPKRLTAGYHAGNAVALADAAAAGVHQPLRQLAEFLPHTRMLSGSG